MFARLLGYIPGPVLFGVVFDLTCIHWQRKCGERGNCWVYENTSLSNGSLGIALIGIFVNFVFTFACWLVYPRKNEGAITSDGDEKGKGSEEHSKRGEFDRHMSTDILLRTIDSGDIASKVSPNDVEGVTKEDGN